MGDALTLQAKRHGHANKTNVADETTSYESGNIIRYKLVVVIVFVALSHALHHFQDHCDSTIPSVRAMVAEHVVERLSGKNATKLTPSRVPQK